MTEGLGIMTEDVGPDKREDRQTIIEESLKALKDEITYLESFITKLETIDPQDVDKEQIATKITFVHFLVQLPNDIAVCRKRINGCVEKLQELLY